MLPCFFQVVVCGGGTHNAFLMDLLKSYARSSTSFCLDVFSADDADWTEAMAFAWLAERRIKGKASNLPQVTGAGREVTLGALHKA